MAHTGVGDFIASENHLDPLRIVGKQRVAHHAFSGSTRSAIQGALLFFGLTDPQGKTDRRLENLARAPNDEVKRQLLAALFDERYGPLLEGIDLPRATRGQIKTAFQNAGSGTETSEKAVSFFVSFGSEAGKELHPALLGAARGQGHGEKLPLTEKMLMDKPKKLRNCRKGKFLPKTPHL